jgi:CRP-like cAMP-binding protein
LFRAELAEPQVVGLPFSCFDALLKQVHRQLSRLGVNQMIVGQPEAEARVAAFVMVQALRTADGHMRNGMAVPLPMSRDDVANHLAINRDTLSRIMMRYEHHGVIERVNRHLIMVQDVDALSRHTAMAPLLIATYGSTSESAAKNKAGSGEVCPG